MPQISPPDLSAIVVAYDSGPQLRRCLDSIRREVRAEDITVEIVVIDNGPGKPSTDDLLGAADMVVLHNERNEGFGAAANQGFRCSRAPLVLLINPDAEFEAGSLAPLLETLQDDPGADLAAPALLLPDGTRQESPRRFYRPATVLARRTPLGRTAAGRKLRQEHLLQDTGVDTARAVDWVSGAAMLLRREAVPQRGPFDERYFLYFEDVDLCRRLRGAGRKVRFQPKSRVRHQFGAGSRRQVPWNPLLWYHLYSGALYGLRWSPGWWRSRWWRTAANRIVGTAVTAGILGSCALALPWLAGPALGLSVHWSPALLVALALAGTMLLPASPLPLAGRAPIPGLPATAAYLALAGASVIAVFAALGGSTVQLSGLALTAAWALLAAAVLNVLRRIRRAGLRRLRRAGAGHVSCLIAGNPEAASTLAERLGEDRSEGLATLGFVALDPLSTGGPTPRLGCWSDVVAVAADLRAESVLLVGNPEELAQMAGEVCTLRRAGVVVTYVMTGANELLQPERALRLTGYPALPLGSGAEARAMEACSRLAGRLAAATGLLLLLPFAPVLLAAATFAARTSPFVSCERIGQGEQLFSMWRLRSGPGAEGCEGGGRLGQLLRRFHLDELPQLWNVLSGDMALVGPRPIAPGVAAKLHGWQRARFRVRPGITGVWQLDRLRRWRLEEMIDSDLLYALRWSPALDARILSETLLGRRNP